MKTFKTNRSKTIPFMTGILFIVTGLVYQNHVLGQFGQNSFESAAALKPAQLELTLYGGGAYYSNDYGSGTWGYIPGFKAGIGIVKNFDVKISYSRGFYKFLSDKFEDSKENNICIMPKVSFLNEHFAIQLPFTVIFARFDDYSGGTITETAYLLQPRIIGSFRIKQIVEFSLSPVFDIMMHKDTDPSLWLGGNLGIALSSNLQKWSIRPEGYFNYLMKDNVSNTMFYGWGIAFTYNIDFKKS